MQYRNFRGTPVAAIGLGTWQLGSADWGIVNPDKALEILSAYTSAGGNFIDTADVYGMGISEKIIGSFLQQTKCEVYVATKLGRRHDAPNGWPQNFSYEYMRRHVEASLQHLGVDCLFLEQLHCIPADELKKGDVFDSLRKLQQEGLIQHFGVSVETTDEALLCLEHTDIASLQIIFNLFRQHPATVFFEKALQQQTALIARVPLASGLLSGKFVADTVFASADHRNYNADGNAFNVGETFSGIEFKKGIALVDEIKNILPGNDLAAQSIQWVLQHPAITTVIPGASTVEQVRANMSATDREPLTAQVISKLSNLYTEKIRPAIRGVY